MLLCRARRWGECPAAAVKRCRCEGSAHNHTWALFLRASIVLQRFYRLNTVVKINIQERHNDEPQGPPPARGAYDARRGITAAIRLVICAFNSATLAFNFRKIKME